jgi:polar amino acid transport system substrate-binding protein
MMHVDAHMLSELAPRGKLRAAINLGNTVLAQRTDGEPSGVSVDLARELAARLNVPVELVTFDAAGKVFDALSSDGWDVAFLAVDPRRAEDIAFTPPYVLIEGAFVVHTDAPFKTSAAIDKEGVRIAVGNGSAYQLYLTRTLKLARLECLPTANEAFTQFIDEGWEAAAGVRQVVDAFASTRDDLRVLDDSFMTIEQAMGVPKARAAAAAFLTYFIEDMKGQGRVAESLQRGGQTAARVAPAAVDQLHRKD